MFPTFEVFGRTFGMYGIMTVIGAAFCVLVGMFLRKKFNIMWEDLALVMIASAFSLFIFAHLVFAITNIDKLVILFRNISNLSFDKIIAMLAECFGGMVFYGGFIGGAIGIMFYCRVINKKLNKNNFLDIYAVLTPLFHIFGRIGCFLGGCCYGVESEFGFTVHGNTLNPMFNKNIMRDKLIYIYMLVYPVVRFIDEFFRGDAYRGFLFGLSTSQWISIILFVFSVTMLIIKHFKKPKPDAAE